MIHYKVSLYQEQSAALDELVGSLSPRVPVNRLFRECLMAVMDNPDLLETVINNCRTVQYRKTGMNVGDFNKALISKMRNRRNA